MTGSRNPGNLEPIPHKTTADNGGAFGEILQPKHQVAFRAAATDATTTQALANGLRADLITLGLMKAS